MTKPEEKKSNEICNWNSVSCFIMERNAHILVQEQALVPQAKEHSASCDPLSYKGATVWQMWQCTDKRLAGDQGRYLKTSEVNT